jgi:hypothetical protein
MFSGQINLSNRSYYYQFDEAMAHSRENAERMRLDPVIDACLRLRTYPTALLTNHIAPDDDTDPFQVQCAAQAERHLNRLPGFLFAKRWLLYEGCFVGRAGVQVRSEWVSKRGRLWHLPTAFQPVSGDKLIFKWDGSAGVLVGAGFGLPTMVTERGPAYMLNPEEREQMVIHHFEPEDVSYYRPQMAGAIKGTGLRGKLFWLWALKMRLWAMGMDFLKWFAKGIMVYYFDHGNDEHRKEVQAWVEGQDGNTALLFPRLRDGGPNYKPVERFDVSTASPAFIQQLITEYFDNLIKLSILGQTLTSSTGSTGLGSGVADAHQQTFENFVKYDAVALQETLTRDLLSVFYRSNFPGVPMGQWVVEVDDPNVQQMIENAQTMYQMGAAIPEGVLLESSGLPEVKTGDTILTNVQPMQPAAVGAMPDNVPVVQGEPVKMSLRQWSEAVTLARKGNTVAKRLFRTRRVVVPGLSERYTMKV